MSEKDQLLAMLERVGIKIEHGVGPGDHTGFQVHVPHRDQRGPDSPVIGYTGFYATFHFDAEGNFLKMGVWE